MLFGYLAIFCLITKHIIYWCDIWLSRDFSCSVIWMVPRSHFNVTFECSLIHVYIRPRWSLMCATLVKFNKWLRRLLQHWVSCVALFHMRPVIAIIKDISHHLHCLFFVTKVDSFMSQGVCLVAGSYWTTLTSKFDINSRHKNATLSKYSAQGTNSMAWLSGGCPRMCNIRNSQMNTTTQSNLICVILQGLS